MGLASDWRKQLKTLMEAPFPEYAEPPVNNTLGGANIPSDAPPIPVIDAQESSTHCVIDCEALKELLNWAGADQAEAEQVVEKAKMLTKQVGVIKSENLNDVFNVKNEPSMGPRTLGISQVTPVAPSGLLSGRRVAYNENLERVMNDEEVEIVKKKSEKDEEK